MSTDFRSELQRLVEAYEEHGGKWPDHHEQALFQAVEDARAVLAQPEPQAPTDEELLAMRSWSSHGPTFDSDLVDFGRRCYNLAKQPVSTPFKLPEPVAPTDEELLRPIMWMLDDSVYDNDKGEIVQSLRELVARWGTPTIQPVPAEPGVADHVTDDEGTRWDRTTDAALWAKAFCLICPEMASREDVMIGWFANAIMAGCDHQAWKMDAELKPVPVSERLPGPGDRDPKLQRCWWLYPGLLPS